MNVCSLLVFIVVYARFCSLFVCFLFFFSSRVEVSFKVSKKTLIIGSKTDYIFKLCFEGTVL